MIAYVDAFVPAFGLIALGALLRRWGGFDQPALWGGIERLVFYVLLPALLASSIGGADLMAVPIGGLLAAVLTGLAAGFAGAAIVARALRLDFPAFTSVVQGGIRFNNFLGLALAGPLFAQEGQAVGSVLVGLIVPLVNVVLVVMFASGGRGAAHAGAMLRAIGTNPLILGCALGFALNLTGGLPPGIGPLLRAVGAASIGLGLMAVGAALSLATLRTRPAAQAAAIGVKLALVPAATAAAALLLGLPPVPSAVVILFMGMPTASTAYVMARQMGGDAELIAAITTSQHVAAAATLPVLVWLVAG